MSSSLSRPHERVADLEGDVIEVAVGELQGGEAGGRE